LICPALGFIGFIRCLLFYFMPTPETETDFQRPSDTQSTSRPPLCRSKEQGLRGSTVTIPAANFYCNYGTPEPVAIFLVCMISKATFETPLQNHIAVAL
jgi:hypothetical protein